ncbi:MAG: HIT family protein [Planctomycetota bacterium]
MTDDPRPCPLCASDAGMVLYRDARLRIVLADEPDWPGFCRVIWNAHVAELTDLDRGGREHVLRAVCATESALRTLLAPDKINLASLGNLVPHLHWHVVPRWRDDSHFPNPIWGVARRGGRRREFDADTLASLRTRIDSALGR